MGADAQRDGRPQRLSDDEALKRVTAATGAVTTVVRARGRVDVHGVATRSGFVWLADNTERPALPPAVARGALDVDRS